MLHGTCVMQSLSSCGPILNVLKWGIELWDEHIYQLHYPLLSIIVFFLRQNAGYQMVCMNDLYTVSELRFNTKT